jgi:hypothetical protein
MTTGSSAEALALFKRHSRAVSFSVMDRSLVLLAQLASHASFIQIWNSFPHPGTKLVTLA